MPFTPGTLQGSDVLDQPPPSPALSTGVNPGTPAPMSQMGGPADALHSQMLPPDVLTGMLKVTTKMAEDLNALAQMTPDLAPYWAAVHDALTEVMSRVFMAGGGPTSPTAPGPGYPGGGIDRGGLPLASGGPA